MSDPRPARPMPPARTGAAQLPRPTPPARPQRAKPDPNPMRLVFGLAGLASATALVTAMLPSVSPAPVAVVEAVDTTTAIGPEPSVVHVKKVVTLQPGQTAPPNAPVVIRPNPTPRVIVRTVTRQSGKP